MKRQVAVSAIGRDRPGIVASFSRVLFERGCNLEESSMTRLKGEFAILLLVTLPEGQTLADIEAAVGAAATELGLTWTLRELGEDETRTADDSRTIPHTLIVYGADRAGIVFKVAEAVASHGINITDLRTRVTGGTAAPVYSLVMELEVGTEAAAEALRRDLAALRSELHVDVTLEAVEVDDL
jgi:glycine cleavage system transcriptional repressor